MRPPAPTPPTPCPLIQTSSDPRVEHDETFTVRFTPTWNVRDMSDPDYDDRCEITLENDDEFTVEAETSTDDTKVNVTLNEGVKDHLLLNWLVNTFDFPIGLFSRPEPVPEDPGTVGYGTTHLVGCAHAGTPPVPVLRLCR